jgi:hypothetical protein
VLTACLGWDSLRHDSWISRGNHRNAAGEWCCGAGDCFIVPKERVMMTGEGYARQPSSPVSTGSKWHWTARSPRSWRKKVIVLPAAMDWSLTAAGPRSN